MDYLAARNRAKAAEREQLSHDPPTRPAIEQFWMQPHGVRLILLQGDVADQAIQVVREADGVGELVLGSMIAYPAHAGTLLSRRRRGAWSVTRGVWFDRGWTKIQETTGSTLTGNVDRLPAFARELRRPIISALYHPGAGGTLYVAVTAAGEVIWNTHVTVTVIQPRIGQLHPTLTGDPTPSGLTALLSDAGFVVAEQLSDAVRMITVREPCG